MTIVNLTPHSCLILKEDLAGDIEGTTETGPDIKFKKFRPVQEIAPSGTVARASQQEEIIGCLTVAGHKVSLVRLSYGQPEDLPEPKEETKYFVSFLTAQAAQAHLRSVDDLIFPGKLVRDRQGRIIGLVSFARL